MRRINPKYTEARRVAVDGISNYRACTRDVVPAERPVVFHTEWRGGAAPPRAPPQSYNDNCYGVTFLVEATRSAKIVDAEHKSEGCRTMRRFCLDRAPPTQR